LKLRIIHNVKKGKKACNDKNNPKEGVL